MSILKALTLTSSKHVTCGLLIPDAGDYRLNSYWESDPEPHYCVTQSMKIRAGLPGPDAVVVNDLNSFSRKFRLPLRAELDRIVAEADREAA